MLQAMNTGHEGSLSTIHANSPRDALSRLETMVLMAGLRAAAARDPAQHLVGARPDRADRAARRRHAPRHRDQRGAAHGGRRDHAPAAVRVQARAVHRGRQGDRLAPADRLRPAFLPKFKRHGIELPDDLFGTAAVSMFGASGTDGSVQRLAAERRGEALPGRSARPAVVCPAAVAAAPAARRLRADDAGRAPAVPRAGLRRRLAPGWVVTAARCACTRTGVRFITCSSRRSLGGYELRCDPRDRCERQHGGRAGRVCGRRGAHVRFETPRSRADRADHVQRRGSTFSPGRRSSSGRLTAALARAPKLAYGTHIFDAVDRSLALLGGARLATGAVVLLSDGADIGSTGDRCRDRTREAAQGPRLHDRAAVRRVRTAPSRWIARRPEALRRGQLGMQLGAIYASLQRRLASEYLVGTARTRRRRRTSRSRSPSTELLLRRRTIRHRRSRARRRITSR